MIQRKGLKVGDRGTFPEFADIFLANYLWANGLTIVTDEKAIATTKNGDITISPKTIVTFVDHGIWSVSKR